MPAVEGRKADRQTVVEGDTAGRQTVRRRAGSAESPGVCRGVGAGAGLFSRGGVTSEGLG